MAFERLRRLLRRPEPAPVPVPASGPVLRYSPRIDGRADPGEIVWAWVPYEDDPRDGKDRPVLVVGREGTTLLGLYLSTNPARDGRPGWFRLGSGPWDRRGRPSWLRLDRVLRLDQAAVRREGAILDRARFGAIAVALRDDHGWSWPTRMPPRSGRRLLRRRSTR